MRLSLNIIIAVIIITFLLQSGCRDEFEPFAESENNLSLFSILDNRLPFQYVRLQRFYQHEDQKKKLDNAAVYISENNGNSYKMTDTSMLNTNYAYYYLPGYKLNRGKTYRITAVLDSNTSSWSDVYVWDNPLAYGSIYSYIIQKITYYSSHFVFDKECANYFIFKLFIEYEINQNGIMTKYYSEVPIEIQILDRAFNPFYTIYDYDKEDFDVRYTSIMKNSDTSNHVRTLYNNPLYYDTGYPGDNIIYTLKFLDNRVENSQITIKKAIFVFYSIDSKIYKYFLTTGKEQYSVRLDEPFYWSNVSTPKGSGYGFVGSITADTLSVKIPAELITKLGYKNGQ